MSSERLARRKGVVSSGAVNSGSNSLDWDSPSTKTGTVKRRPASSDCSTENELNLSTNSSESTPITKMKAEKRIHKATLTSPLRSPENENERLLYRSRMKKFPSTGFEHKKFEDSNGVSNSILSSRFLARTQYNSNRVKNFDEAHYKTSNKIPVKFNNYNERSQEQPSTLMNFHVKDYSVSKGDYESSNLFQRNFNTKIRENNREPKRGTKLDMSSESRSITAGTGSFEPIKNASPPHRKSRSPPKDEGTCNEIKEVKRIQEPTISTFDNPKWILSLTEGNAYLIERKANGFNFGKAGIVSDSDSGIASPLSPSSVYGFVAWGDKNEGCKRDLEVLMELERLKNCSCVDQQIQVILMLHA